MAAKNTKSRNRGGGKGRSDWTRYAKPPRLLSPEQEEALSQGGLRDLMPLIAEAPGARLEIRSRSMNVYHRGANVMRVRGDEPFTFEFDTATGIEAVTTETDADIAVAIQRLDTTLRELEARHEHNAMTDRSAEQALAEANDGRNAADGAIVVVDTGYSYGPRRWGALALVRREGVTGPGGFANPRMALVDVRTTTRGLTGSGLAESGADFADLTKALGGEHLERVRREIEELVAQKQRLGLLDAGLDVRGLVDESPLLLVCFIDTDTSSPEYDAAFQALHDRVAARHLSSTLIRFCSLESSARLGVIEDDLMSYRSFKTYRHQGR